MPSLTLGRNPPRVPSRDGRSREARLMARVRAELTAHLGKAPSATERALIERAAWLTLHVARLDEQTIMAGGMSDHAAREYLAWSNTLSRTLRHLGLKGAAERPPTLREYLDAKAAAP